VKALSSRRLLSLWETVSGLDATERAVHLCAAALPGLGLDAARALPVGRRDRALAALRHCQFGARADCYVECPRCHEGLEFPLDMSAVGEAPPDPGHTEELCEGSYRVRYRLPNTADLQAFSRETDATAARLGLLERCVAEARCGDDAVAVSALPATLLEAVEREMERRDPHAAVDLELRCAACLHSWSMHFDVGAFLWDELDREARRLLHEVAALARAYGWAEADVLRLGRQRRRFYIELAGEA
jgi:hypothetical protein